MVSLKASNDFDESFIVLDIIFFEFTESTYRLVVQKHCLDE